MRQTRGFYQRKSYGVVRMSLAMARASKAKGQEEREKAGISILAWSQASGLRRFKIERNTKHNAHSRKEL